MRPTRVLLVIIATGLLAGACFTAPALPADLMARLPYIVVQQTFAELYESAERGEYDGTLNGPFVAALYASEGLSVAERDALSVLMVSRAEGPPRDDEALQNVTAVLLSRFGTLEDPFLRARVLLLAHEAKYEDTRSAVMASAVRLARMTGARGTVVIAERSEAEAMAVASLAPAYPSPALAELLRVMASGTTNRSVAAAARTAARSILSGSEE